MTTMSVTIATEINALDDERLEYRAMLYVLSYHLRGLGALDDAHKALGPERAQALRALMAEIDGERRGPGQ